MHIENEVKLDFKVRSAAGHAFVGPDARSGHAHACM